jgi:hypothetical protein
MTGSKIQAARKLLASGTPPHAVAQGLACFIFRFIGVLPK